MAQRNEALATAFEQVARRIVTAAESLSDVAWDVVPAGEARTAGQIAHHEGFLLNAQSTRLKLHGFTMGSSSKTEEDAHPNRSSQSTFWGQKLKHEKALAHHMANVYRNVGGFIQLAVAGQPLPALTIKDIHDRNA